MTLDERQRIISKICFEEEWLKNIKMNNGFISLADIEVAMSGIRHAVDERLVDLHKRKEKNK